MISLLKWAKREGISYSHAQKLLAEGKIDGALRSITGKRIMVPISTELPRRDTVTCAICERSFPQITGTHLKLHGISWDEYRAKYPDIPTVGKDVSTAISNAHSDKEITTEQRTKISATKMGTTPWNKGLIGVQIPTDETRQKMAESHTGLKHTEAAKAKIGEGNRGKIMPRDDVERRAQALREKYRDNPGPFSGQSHKTKTKAIMSQKATAREANYTPEQRAAINEAIGNSVRGIKRTPEQKERYRESRVKWMSENPTKVINTTGERSVAEWLDRHHISYVRQYVIPGLHHPYDFHLPDHDTIIEFDGAHHWWRPWFNVLGKTTKEREEMLLQTMIKDAVENMYAGFNGHRIIRIRGVADVGDSEEYGSLEDQLRIQGFLMP